MMSKIMMLTTAIIVAMVVAGCANCSQSVAFEAALKTFTSQAKIVIPVEEAVFKRISAIEADPSKYKPLESLPNDLKNILSALNLLGGVTTTQAAEKTKDILYGNIALFRAAAQVMRTVGEVEAQQRWNDLADATLKLTMASTNYIEAVHSGSCK